MDKPAGLRTSRTLDGTLYHPGVVGLNNIKANDYCNVILQALSHVTPIRNFFLDEKNYSKIKHPSGDSPFALVQRFGELMRKLWNPRNFKAHVSPHEMLQSIVLWSNKRYQIIEQSDPIDFLTWLLHELHRQLRGNKKPDSSIINKTFLGEMKVYSRKIPPVEISDEGQKEMLLASEEYQVILIIQLKSSYFKLFIYQKRKRLKLQISYISTVTFHRRHFLLMNIVKSLFRK